MDGALPAVDLTLDEVDFLFESISVYEQKFRIETPAPIAKNINEVRAKLLAILELHDSRQLPTPGRNCAWDLMPSTDRQHQVAQIELAEFSGMENVL
jgi:hypothetical protein